MPPTGLVVVYLVLAILIWYRDITWYPLANRFYVLKTIRTFSLAFTADLSSQESERAIKNYVASLIYRRTYRGVRKWWFAKTWNVQDARVQPYRQQDVDKIFQLVQKRLERHHQ